MKSTPSSARRIARFVLIAVAPTYWPTSAGAVDLDEVALLQEAHRAVHLREQARDRRLARARVAEEDEVLARRDLGQPVLLAARLHLQEGDERVHLLLDRLEPDERVELGLQLLERQRRQAARREPVAEPFLELGPGRAPQLVAERSGPRRAGSWAWRHGSRALRCRGAFRSQVTDCYLASCGRR